MTDKGDGNSIEKISLQERLAQDILTKLKERVEAREDYPRKEIDKTLIDEMFGLLDGARIFYHDSEIGEDGYYFFPRTNRPGLIHRLKFNLSSGPGNIDTSDWVEWDLVRKAKISESKNTLFRNIKKERDEDVYVQRNLTFTQGGISTRNRFTFRGDEDEIIRNNLELFSDGKIGTITEKTGGSSSDAVTHIPDDEALARKVLGEDFLWEFDYSSKHEEDKDDFPINGDWGAQLSK